MICGYQIVFFCCFSRYFRGVGDSGENCVRSVLVVRLHNFGQVGKGDAEMFWCWLSNVRSCSTTQHSAPSKLQLVVPSLRHFRRNRPSALWASQPSLFSCPLISTFVLQFSLFSFFFSNFSSFHPFPSSLPFSCPLFSHNFPAFFLHLLSLPAFSSIFWSSRHVSL